MNEKLLIFIVFIIIYGAIGGVYYFVNYKPHLHKIDELQKDVAKMKKEVERINTIDEELENAEKDLTKELSYSNVVTPPMIPDKKAYPLRSLIMLMFTASVVFLSFVVIIIYENSQEKKTQSN